MIYTVEFQKCGLPHVHILLTLKPEDRGMNVIETDRVVSVEIPDEEQFPSLLEKVKNYFIHGPCGKLNPNVVCIEEGKCSRNTLSILSRNFRTNIHFL